MDYETARYIYVHYMNLLTENESLAVRHYTTCLNFKIEDIDNFKSENPSKYELFINKKFLTDNPEALTLIKPKVEDFILNAAQRIYKDHSDKIFLNNCPKCKKLTRTPLAKQCRHCHFDWHD